MRKEFYKRRRAQRRRLIKIFIVVAAALLLGAGLMIVLAQRRRAEERPRRVSSNTIEVKKGQDLQSAINVAQPGDTIVLEAGASFPGPITLPNKAGAAFITIQSSALASLPPAGQRVSPSHAALMP
ncbi:MAG TPA: hypothetical protein VGC91_14265, partial [Pyrinomonadaceae bacterium]